MILYDVETLRKANYEFRNDLDRYNYERFADKLLMTMRNHDVRKFAIPFIWVCRVSKLVDDMISKDPNIRIFEIVEKNGLLKVTYLSNSRSADDFEKFKELIRQAQIDTHESTMARVDLMLSMEGK